MWVFENKTGKLTDATIENATEMVKKDGGFSCLWPRGTDEEEAKEFERLKQNDLGKIPVPPKAPDDERSTRTRHRASKE